MGLFQIVLIVSLLFVAMGCIAQDQSVIKIGYTGPLTGEVAIAGQENVRGVQLAIDKINDDGGINGKMLELAVKDDMFNTKEAVTQYHQLVYVENVDFITTATYGGFLAWAEQAEQNNVILLETLDTSNELAGLGKNSFAVGIYDEGIGYAIANYLNENEIDEVGLIFNIEDPFLGLVYLAFSERFNGTVEKEEYLFSTSDFRTILEKLKKYDYIVLLGFEENGRIVRQAKEMEVNSQFIGIDTMASQDFIQNTGNNHEGLLFTYWEGNKDNSIYKELINKYKEKYGAEPENNLFLAVGYDAMLSLGETLKSCGEELDCIKNQLSGINISGATGQIIMDDDHITRSVRERIYTYKDGAIIEAN
ncbi:ABC transporter substrate-binding protein [Candidatus Micrarchaeota archaeon]|nr:ABC transporter substrate-binding protein [Candidatus Micrarchaeota archaeon]MBU1929936.1 ABC transporter substrate-binding protein [Candidatus Micrarchaeota archaeon]